MATNTTTTDGGWLTVVDVAERLSLSRRAVLHRIRRGTLPAQKIGSGRTHAYLVRTSDVERAIEEARR